MWPEPSIRNRIVSRSANSSGPNITKLWSNDFSRNRSGVSSLLHLANIKFATSHEIKVAPKCA
jgi:hypothetical protein